MTLEHPCGAGGSQRLTSVVRDVNSSSKIYLYACRYISLSHTCSLVKMTCFEKRLMYAYRRPSFSLCLYLYGFKGVPHAQSYLINDYTCTR